jgi:hypothetical protein
MRTVLIIIVTLLSMAGNAAAYEWTVQDGLEGWRFSHVGSLRKTPEGVLLFKEAGSRDFSFSPPAGTVGDARVVTIEVRTLASGAQMACVLFAGNKQISERLPIFSGRSWKELKFDFTEKLQPGAVVEDVVFLSNSEQPVEIGVISVQEESFSDFLIPEGMKAYDVNFLPPFILFGYSLNAWCYGAILLSGVGIFLFAFLWKKKGMRPRTLIAAVFLCCFLLIGLREVLDEFDIMDTTYEDFLKAPPMQKRYHYMADCIEFADFIRRNMPVGESTLYLFSDYDHYLYLKYLLYPLKVILKRPGDAPGRTNVFYHAGVTVEGDRLVSGGKVLYYAGRAISYGPGTLLYLR